MLILTRKPGESIVAGDCITVTVLEVRGGLVKLGVEAPRDVHVHRLEVYERILQENRASAALGPEDINLLDRLFAPGKGEGR